MKIKILFSLLLATTTKKLKKKKEKRLNSKPYDVFLSFLIYGLQMSCTINFWTSICNFNKK